MGLFKLKQDAPDEVDFRAGNFTVKVNRADGPFKVDEKDEKFLLETRAGQRYFERDAEAEAKAKAEAEAKAKAEAEAKAKAEAAKKNKA